nr:tRNA (adenine(22)-N(1))-methyltransferase TrmK [Deltaproteobacteria bacterium]
PFRAVEVAVIAGMGWRTIARILEAGPRPPSVVLHAEDDPGSLRAWLAGSGWSIEAEDLVAVGPRFAQACRAVAGVEPASGLDLWYGPHLSRRTDPLAAQWLARELARQQGIAAAAGGSAAGTGARSHVSFLQARLRLCPGAAPGYVEEGTGSAGRPQGDSC